MNHNNDRPIDRLRRALHSDRARLRETLDHHECNQGLLLDLADSEIDDLAAALHCTDVARLEAIERLRTDPRLALFKEDFALGHSETLKLADEFRVGTPPRDILLERAARLERAMDAAPSLLAPRQDPA